MKSEKKFWILKNTLIEEHDVTFYGSTYDSNNNVLGKMFSDGIAAKNDLDSPLKFIIYEEKSDYGPKKVMLDKICLMSQNLNFVFCCSESAKDVLEEFNPGKIEFIPFEITGRKENYKQYNFVNVLAKINCINQEKSKVRFSRVGTLRAWKSLVLDSSLIPESIDIFLIGEASIAIYVVSEKLKQAIENAGLSGFKFFKPEEFTTYS